MADPVPVHDALHPSVQAALDVWAQMVRANREQAERFREKPERGDFYAPTAAAFKVDPRRSGDEVLEVLRDLARDDETWLDIGAGGGRFALPLALKVREVITVEPSVSMRTALLQGMKDQNIGNIRIIEGRWPLENPPAAEGAPSADGVLIAHVGYDIELIGPFLEAMEAATRRLCVAVFTDKAPSAAAAPFWPDIHGEKRHPLPSLREFIALQLARGRLCEVRLASQSSPGYPDRELLLSYLRQQLFIEREGEKARLLEQLVDREVKANNGRFSLSSAPSRLGIVAWRP